MKRLEVSDPRTIGQRIRSAEQLHYVTSPWYFIDCDFSNIDFYEVDMHHWQFDACDFRGARLNYCSHAKFFSCDLRGAKLAGADFRWVEAVNCRIDGADIVGIQTTMDCHFWNGTRSESKHDAYLLLYWLSQINPVLEKLATDNIPDRVKALLEQTFQRDV